MDGIRPIVRSLFVRGTLWCMITSIDDDREAEPACLDPIRPRGFGMAEVSTSTADQDPLWRKRWMLLASMIVVFAATILLVSIHHADWSWPLFFWGVAVGLTGLALIAALLRRAAKRPEITEDQRLRLRRRLLIYAFCWIAAGLICGSVAATFDRAWIDIAVTAYVAVTLGAGGLVLFRRRNSVS
jgi:peptidoglycan/LPS O-acetylase OafA/YrhL